MQPDCEITGVQECIIRLSSENDPQYPLCLSLPAVLSVECKESLSDFFQLSAFILRLLAGYKYCKGRREQVGVTKAAE